MVQNDLDILKDVLRTENLSLDSSTLMGLFNADDPLSLNLPEFNKNTTNQDDENNDNQIIAYSPSNLIDFNDMLDVQLEDFINVQPRSQSSPTELSTPLIEDDPSLSPESKRFKK
ncbi:hypothetical protein O3M35_002419 [Rhynocoris fuscipes]|uniref:Uncharacterized protein n=1 Tax=Rhynocoris fuscipes TaxID=488301 RepID=A0AAW1CK85_9HEMI